MPLKVFIDSDVVISSLISSTGAAFLILNQTNDLDLFVSNISIRELEEVVKRLNLDQKQLKELIDQQFSVTQLKETIKEIKTSYLKYVLDIDDAHVVAGAKAGAVQFLISYNTKHFKVDKLKGDFNITLMTPANFLQYLRSL